MDGIFLVFVVLVVVGSLLASYVNETEKAGCVNECIT